MFALAQILFIIYNAVTAEIHASKFAKDKKVKHGWWGLWYFLIVSAVCYLFYKHSSIRDAWMLGVLSICIRMVVFNICVNLFVKPKRYWLYVSRETDSHIDKAHYFVFGNKMWLWVIIYTAGVVVINVVR